jgi:hypothetical protein
MQNWVCAVCDRAGAVPCRSCGCCAYCSKECQRSDRPTHELLCSKWKTHPRGERPAGCYRAIYFPMGGDQPLLIWYNPRNDELTKTLLVLKPGRLADCYRDNSKSQTDFFDDDDFESREILSQEVRKRSSRFVVLTSRRGEEIESGMSRKDNRILVKAARQIHDKTPLGKWKGPIIAHGEGKARSIFNPELYGRLVHDINLHDFRLLLEHVAYDGRWEKRLPELAMRRAQVNPSPIVGLKLNSNGTASRRQGRAFYTIDVPADHPLRTGHSKCQLLELSVALGYPLLCFRFRAIRQSPDGWDNENGASLAMSFSIHDRPGDVGWHRGGTYADFRGNFGDTIVIAADGTDLDMAIMRDMLEYVRPGGPLRNKIEAWYKRGPFRRPGLSDEGLSRYYREILEWQDEVSNIIPCAAKDFREWRECKEFKW